MFMQFRGGGVGHIGTRFLDLRTMDYPQEIEGDGAEEDLGTHEEHGEPEPSNREDVEEEDEDEDTENDEDEDADEEQEVSGNMNNEQDDLGDEEGMDNDEILDNEGFAEL